MLPEPPFIAPTRIPTPKRLYLRRSAEMYNQQDSRLQLAIPDTTTITVFDRDSELQILTPSSTTTVVADRDSKLQTLTPSSTTTAVFGGDPALQVKTPSTTTLVSDGEDCEKSISGERPAIPPADHGKDAWLFLAACFFVDALAWGM